MASAGETNRVDTCRGVVFGVFFCTFCIFTIGRCRHRREDYNSPKVTADGANSTKRANKKTYISPLVSLAVHARMRSQISSESMVGMARTRRAPFCSEFLEAPLILTGGYGGAVYPVKSVYYSGGWLTFFLSVQWLVIPAK